MDGTLGIRLVIGIALFVAVFLFSYFSRKCRGSILAALRLALSVCFGYTIGVVLFHFL